ncbi:MAG: hypothetical protein J6V06_03495 [Clostridia bacterium]|nr:hypothetical protein [Clostridia bacterium]MBO7319068.1 hypothetical protein [Clostridia bacterium]
MAYIENKNYNALSAKYDQTLEKVSDLEVSVAALMSASVSDTSDSSPSYPAETPTESTTTTEEENTASATESTTASETPSGTYYVTQSGNKYHTAYCSYLSKSKIAITMDRIKAEGYSPCSRCIK